MIPKNQSRFLPSSERTEETTDRQTKRTNHVQIVRQSRMPPNLYLMGNVIFKDQLAGHLSLRCYEYINAQVVSKVNRQS